MVSLTDTGIANFERRIQGPVHETSACVHAGLLYVAKYMHTMAVKEEGVQLVTTLNQYISTSCFIILYRSFHYLISSLFTDYLITTKYYSKFFSVIRFNLASK